MSRLRSALVRPERVVAGRADLGAGLPPTVLADHDARVETVVEPRAGAHPAFGRLDRHPVAVGDAARLRCSGMQFHFRMRMRACAGSAARGAGLLQNKVGFALVRISGKRAVKIGPRTGPICGSSKSGSGA